jgi:DNA modification methylase
MPKNTEKYEMIDISALHPYENNARTHSNEQLEAICNSIREFGFINPVIIDENNMILVGHGRIEASKMLGLTQAPFRRVTNLTDDQKRAYILADNKLSDLGGWDEELLAQELENISLDMTAFGFDDFNIDIDEPEIEEDDFDVDGDLETAGKVSKGQLWKLGDHFLMCGDATSEADIKTLIGGSEIALVLTDAPYGVDVVGNNGEVGADFGVAKKGKYSKIIADDTTETAEKAYKILSKICDNLILWGGNYFTEFLPFSDSWLIWDKRCDSGIRNTFADGEMAWCSFHTPVRIYHQLWNGMIREGEHEKRVHPTQKPVKMLGDILKDFTSPADTVLDVFGGSGSTLIACEKLNRKCFMMELDAYYCEVIIQRWENLTGKTAELVKEA